ncbi:hypothetical protein AAL_00867 [Moelleriella libera RCEF 2490]|uniref:Uncharacterized protein n=1 Tax=Moelleriella libera RCEF 2490 TaxID=1081109 RepID=A0A166V8Y5_9HYPO|nr:hypothetical protein AAL_00867 [Moelleriella libera RCEF 2490]
MHWASSKNNPYWQTGREDQIRVLKSSDLSFTAKFGALKWPDDLSLPSTTPAVLRGYLETDSNGLETEPCTEDVPLDWPVAQGFECEGAFKSPRTHLPWGLKGTIHWSLVLFDYGNSRMKISETVVELYFIATENLQEFHYAGLPASFMRRFLLPLRRMTEDGDIKSFKDETLGRNIRDSEQGWLDYVIDKIHFQSSTRYDSWQSNNSYFQGGGNRRLQMKFMRPFGYINDTNLIGWGPCNSPLTTNRSKFFQKSERNDPARTGFGNHVFITILPKSAQDINGPKEMVLDATCRPQQSAHSGRETLEEYIKASIDDTTTLYDTPARLELGKLVTDASNPNPINWKGVTQLITEPEIFSPDFLNNKKPGADNVLLNVVEEFKKMEWNVSLPNVIINDTDLTAQWFLTSADGESMNLSISRSATLGSARFSNNAGTRPNALRSAHELYSAAKEALDSEGIVLTDDKSKMDEDIGKLCERKGENNALVIDKNFHSSLPKESERGIMLWVQGTFFVKLMKDKKESMAKCVEKVMDLIAAAEKVLAAAVPTLEVEEPKEAFPVGTEFELVLKLGNPAGQPQKSAEGDHHGETEDMIPIDVEIRDAKVLYLSSSRSGDTVTFRFLARAVTEKPDEIIFSVYNSALKLATHTTGPLQINIE